MTDADLAVALDVLQERFSPVKPYEYSWDRVEVLPAPLNVAGAWSAVLVVPDGRMVEAFLSPLNMVAAWPRRVERAFARLEEILARGSAP